MSSVVSIHTLKGKVVGSGVIVADDLILTCAHVVNAAIGRQQEDQTRPGAGDKVEIRFAASPGVALRAKLNPEPDAWSPPPATRAEGADLCVLKLEGKLPEKASIAQLEPVRFSKEFTVRVSGYPEDWNRRAELPQLDIAQATVLGAEGYLWLLRADPGTRLAATAKGKRVAGLIYTGFSGGPVQAGEAVVGLAAQVREEAKDATSYAIPAHNFPVRILAAHLIDSKQQKLPACVGSLRSYCRRNLLRSNIPMSPACVRRCLAGARTRSVPRPGA